MKANIIRFLHDRSGATAIEYGLIVAILSLAIVGGVSNAGNALEALWSGTANTVESFTQ